MLATPWILRLILLAPVALLLVIAAPRLKSGRAADAVFPVPIFMTMGLDLPLDTYRATEVALAEADNSDGLLLIQRAEAASHSDATSDQILRLLREGLSRTPASVRGWAILAKQLGNQDMHRAGQALAQSFLLGPYEFYVAGNRARSAALLWNALDADTRQAALRQARLLWTNESLRPEILMLLQTQAGSDLLTHAFEGQPDELRALNRWVAERRRIAAKR